MDFEQITKIELVTEDGGIAVAPQFRVTFKDDTTVIVPSDPINRHYIEIKQWYDEQTKKPFKYDFKKNKPA